MAARVKVRFDADTRGLERGTKKVESAVGGLSKKAVAAGAGFLSLGAGVAAAKGAIGFTIDLAKGTAQLSRTTGMDSREASRWVATAKSRGIETKALTMGMVSLSKNIRGANVEGSKQQTLFERLGVSQRAIKEGDTAAVIGDLSDAFAKMPNGARKAAIAQQLFGRQAQTLLPLLNKGSAALREQLSLSDKYGTTLSQNQVGKALEAAQATREWKMALNGLSVTFATAVLPSLTSGVTWLASFVNQVRLGQGMVGNLVHSLVSMGAQFVTSRGAVVLLGAALGMLAGRMAMLAGTFAAAKIGAFIGLLGQMRNMFVLISAAIQAGAISRLPALLGVTAASMTAMLGPVGLIVGALAGAGLAFGLFGQKQRETRAQTHLTTEAINKQREAIQRVRDTALNNQSALLTYQQAQLDVREAVRLRTQAEQASGRSSDAFRGANIRVKQAVIERTRAYGNLHDVETKQQDLNFALRLSGERVGKSHTQVKQRIDPLADAYRLLMGKEGDYRQGSGRTRSANRKMGRNVDALAGTWGDFVNGFGQSVNQTLGKLGAKPLTFKLGPFTLKTKDWEGRAHGGFLSGPSRRDSIPILAGADEAVVTGHQQAPIETALAYAASAGVVPYGSMDDVFAGVTTPHYMARGGNVGEVGKAGARKLRLAGRAYLNKQIDENGIFAMIRRGNAIAAKGMPYQYGGFGNPSYDCSGYVSAILNAGGVNVGRSTTVTLRQLLQPGPGRTVTVGVRGGAGRSGHTMMKAGKVFFESGGGHGPARVGGWNGSFDMYHPRGFGRGGIVRAGGGKKPSKAVKRQTRRAVSKYQRRAELEDALFEAGKRVAPDTARRLKRIDQLLARRGLARDDRLALLGARAAIIGITADTGAVDEGAGSVGPSAEDIRANTDALAELRKAIALSNTVTGAELGRALADMTDGQLAGKWGGAVRMTRPRAVLA